MGKPVPPLLGEGLVAVRVLVAAENVVLVRAFMEARDGLGVLFAERGGDLQLAAPLSRRAELLEFIEDLAEEMPISVVEPCPTA